MIPEAAVEALARILANEALFNADIEGYGWDSDHDSSDHFMPRARSRAREYLEAAAPHMLAEETEKMVHMSEKTHWEITYYGTGMSPQVASFDNEAEALATWEDWKADPYKGASSIKRVTVLDKA